MKWAFVTSHYFGKAFMATIFSEAIVCRKSPLRQLMDRFLLVLLRAI